MISCKSSPKIMEELCGFLIEEAYSLQSLGLICMGLSTFCVNLIAEFIQNAVCIQGLDISQNDLLPNAFE